jgi:hypothetical protein
MRHRSRHRTNDHRLRHRSVLSIPAAAVPAIAIDHRLRHRSVSAMLAAAVVVAMLAAAVVDAMLAAAVVLPVRQPFTPR